jgi:hypothetical protein
MNTPQCGNELLRLGGFPQGRGKADGGAWPTHEHKQATEQTNKQTNKQTKGPKQILGPSTLRACGAARKVEAGARGSRHFGTAEAGWMGAGSSALRLQPRTAMCCP